MKKDTTMEKASEYEESTTEKAKGKDTTVGKITELKDSAADAARKAIDYLTGKKEETKEKAQETREAAKQKAEENTEASKEKHDETKEEARRKMEEMKIEGERDQDEAFRRAEKSEATGGGGGGGGILGALGSVKDAIKDKLSPGRTYTREEKEKDTIVSYGGEGEPKAGRRLAVDKEGTPVVVQAADVEATPAESTASRLKEAEQDTRVLDGGGGEPKAGRRLAVDKEGTPVVVAVDVEATPVGATSSRLKEAEQMIGQTFNDDGRLDDEGVARVRLDRPGKM